MTLLIFYLLLALFISFLCSVLEAVILSSTISFIQDKEQKGSSAAKLLHKLKHNIDRPLSAILTINTIAHTIGAAGVGAQATAVFGEAYFGIISAVLTLLILIFSEIIPKTIGATYWRVLALPSSRIIQLMILISFPLVWFSEIITRFISKNNKDQAISRAEVAVLANIGAKQGVINESESVIINNLLKLSQVKAKDIMTPRTVVVRAPETLKILDYFNHPDYLNFSRIPLYEENPDDITGYAMKFDVLERVAYDKFNLTLKDIKRPIVSIYENTSVPNLFNEMLEKKEHIAAIFDEFGSVTGIVTLEDVIETLLGLEIIDETDKDIDMQKLAKEKWKIRAQRLKGMENDLRDLEK